MLKKIKIVLFPLFIWFVESFYFMALISTLFWVAEAALYLGCVHFHNDMSIFHSIFSKTLALTGVERLRNLSYLQIATCGFEDLIFVLPLLVLKKMNLPEPLLIAATIFSSLFFMSGHLYQGIASAMVKVIYPPVAYWYARRHGISRTAGGHIMMDCWALFLLKNFM